MYISIPNYYGWKVYLDEQEVELSKYNIIYMGFPISENAHDIKPAYEPPLLKLGALVSFVSLASFIALESIKRKAKYN